MQNNAIWIVNNDEDDHELIREIFSELGSKNEVVFFLSGMELIERLQSEKNAPFIVMCEVNLPGMDGFMLRQQLLKTPNKKFHSVPFIFWSNSATDVQIEKAYRLMSHGFFIKEPTFEEWKHSFSAIIKYWQKSKMPPKIDSYGDPLFP